MSEKTDEQLMAAWRDDDANAFDELYGRYKDMLYRYVMRQTGRQAVADEVFQEAWTALIRNRKTYTVSAKFKTYLFHIAHSKLVDYYRQSDKHSALSYDDLGAEYEQVTEEQEQPEQQADTGNKLQRLMVQLDRLPAAQREIFLMHEESGMGLNEIAGVLGISRDTAKSRLRYALEKLRIAMGPYA